MTAHILLVDEDPNERRLLKNAIEQFGYHVQLAENLAHGTAILKAAESSIDAVIIDLAASAGSSQDFIEELAALGLDVPVIVQTGQGGLDHVVASLRAGAFDFVVKPVSPERLKSALNNALQLNRAGYALPLRRYRQQAVNFASIISASSAMMRVVDLGRRAAHNHMPILLEGEGGVGKELVARAIHNASDRSSKPFVVVNCGGVEAATFDELLFGPDGKSPDPSLTLSKCREAEGGTLFLDEVGDLPLSTQVKLLRLVQDGVVDTNGVAAKANLRLICATKKNLIDEVRAGNLREDLYYRLSVFPISIAALRRRKEDISYLVRMFVERYSAELRKPRLLGISPAAMALLTSYDWPGNIRQLENAIYRAVALTQEREIIEQDFPQLLVQMPQHMPRIVQSASAPALIVSNDEAALPHEGDLREGMASNAERAPQSYRSQNRSAAIASIDEDGNVRKLAEIEEELIRFALGFYRGQMSQVARKLGIGRSTLYRKLKDYGIDPDDPLKDVA